MAYQLQRILDKCDKEDLRVLVYQIDNYVSFTDDQALKLQLDHYVKTEDPAAKVALIHAIEEQ